MLKETTAAAILALTPSFTIAQSLPPAGAIPFYVCAPSEQLYDSLSERYGEQPLFEWLSSPIHINKFWWDAADGSVSVTRENVDVGIACITQSGENAIPSQPHTVKPQAEPT